ncbi:MAG: hypothetical protein JW751_26800 [Polyangiaceae bacterium]|nr:hypothetical protein [Polyangiaceae bacterium]
MRRPGVTVILLCAGAVPSCTSKGSYESIAADDGSGLPSGEASGVVDPGAASPTSPVPAVVEPEVEAESSYRSPVLTGHYIWATNPDSGQVALIDARDRSVRTVEAGHGPEILAAIPAADGSVADRAIVLNRISRDATVLAVDDAGELEEPVFVTDVHAGANAMTVSSRGRFVIAWTDSAELASPDPLEGFQEVTVIDLGAAAPRATRLSVGYRPSRLFISEDQSRAFAVTEPGVSVIDLGDEPEVSQDIALTDEPLPDDWVRDVTLTPDGGYALVRVQDPAADPEVESEVGIVSMQTGERAAVRLAGPVTDLDLSDDGSLAVAVVSARYAPAAPAGQAGAGGEPGTGASSAAAGSGGSAGAAQSAGTAGVESVGAAGEGDGGTPATGGSAASTGGTGGAPEVTYDRLPSQIALLPVPGILDRPDSFDLATVGDEMVRSVSLSTQGSYAVLFSTAEGAEDRDHITILNIDPASSGYLGYRTEPLRSSFVRSVLVAADDSYAVAVLTPGGNSSAAGAFAVIPVIEDLAIRIEPTEAPPVAVAIGPAPTTMAAVTTSSSNGAGHFTYFVRLPDPVINKVELLSLPLATGIVATDEIEAAYVAQSHPEGRLTFIEPDPETQNVIVHDLTGFEQGRLTAIGRQ